MGENFGLEIKNPTEDEFLKRIEWNKDDFMVLVASIMEQYKDLIYSESQIKEAKADRARLNAMKKAISDRRIQVKKELMKPYEIFEAEVKEVTALIDKPIEMIDMQIKGYEEKIKEEKKVSLEEYFNEIKDKCEYSLSFDKVFDQKWLNANVSLKKAKEELNSKIDTIVTDLMFIESFSEKKYHAQLKDFYIRKLNINATMEECKRLREIERREEERREREEEARLKAELETSAIEQSENVAESEERESNKAETAPTPTEDIKKNEEMATHTASNATVTDSFVPKEDNKQYKASFTIYGTKTQIMAVKQYMIDNNIRFGKVEK